MNNKDYADHDIFLNLHADIMNIPCHPSAIDFSNQELRAYKEGHRDARHAAAELAAQAPAPASQDALDAARYRWMSNRGNSLETAQHDKGIRNGPSCYHEVGGIRELKHGDTLDAAIDAAIVAAKEAT